MIDDVKKLHICREIFILPRYFDHGNNGRHYYKMVTMTKKKREINIPDFEPRDYQLPFLRAMDSGCKRAVLVWHRRSGKEVVCFNWCIKMAYWHRVGTYVYFFPTSGLGRRILWDGINKDGKRFLDYIPKEIIDGNPNNVEMKVRLINGSSIQIIGTDQILNVGINPVGCIFSEYSLQDPKSWNYIRPILRENGGWSIFNFTPRGRNHAHDLYLMAKNNDDWFCESLGIRETGVLSDADMDIERREGMSEQLIQQEYYCNFDQGCDGTYYAKLLNQAILEKRVCSVPHDINTEVYTYWDLGIGDETVILFVQYAGKEIHIIDMYRMDGENFTHYAKVLRDFERNKGYCYAQHWAPHDIRVRELANTSLSRWHSAKELGIHFQVCPNIGIMEGIEKVRGIFNLLWIDEKKCEFLIKCTENYHRAYNEKFNVYSDKPVHDWSSHVCDALRYMAVAYSKSGGDARGMTERDAMSMQDKYMIRL